MAGRILMFTAVLLLSLPVRAEQGQAGSDAEIQLRIAATQPAWVGQKQELQLELWTNAMSFSGQTWVLPEVPGGFLLQSDSNALKLAEKRDGSDWQGLRYTFELFPQRPGEIVVAPFEVRFSVREGYGKPEQPQLFRTPERVLQASMPPGADSGGLIVSSTGFVLDVNWSPELPEPGLAKLKVGDALTLEIRREAPDVPGMVFAPIPRHRIEGLGIYAGNPRVEDRSDRGDFTGSRTDTLTVVAEQAGVYTLPKLEFQWWDPERELLSQKVVPELEIRVAQNPAWSGAAAGAGETPGRLISTAAWLVPVAVALFFALRCLLPVLRTRRDRWRRQRRSSEAWAFQQALKRCRAGTAPEAYRALNDWLRCAEKKGFVPFAGCRTLDGLAARSGDTALAAQSTALQVAVARAAPGESDKAHPAEWDGKKMAAALKRLRNRWLDQGRVEAAALTPLNPRPFTKRT